MSKISSGQGIQVSPAVALPWTIPRAKGTGRGYLRRDVLHAFSSLVRRALPRDPANDNTVLEHMADHLRGLISSGYTGKAKAILAQLTPEQKTHPAIAKWSRVLSPPKIRVGPPGSSHGMEEDAAWLRAHAAEYAGHWVALRHGVLMGYDDKHSVLYRRLQAQGQLQDVVFIRLTDGMSVCCISPGTAYWMHGARERRVFMSERGTIEANPS